MNFQSAFLQKTQETGIIIKKDVNSFKRRQSSLERVKCYFTIHKFVQLRSNSFPDFEM